MLYYWEKKKKPSHNYYCRIRNDPHYKIKMLFIPHGKSRKNTPIKQRHNCCVLFYCLAKAGIKTNQKVKCSPNQ